MENTLNIQITLNDEQLKNLIIGNISELPKDKLQDILLQAIKEVMTSSDGQKMFIEPSRYYGSTNNPTEFLKRLVDKADIKDTISPVVNQVVAEFATNYPAILEKCLKSSITDMFMDNFSRCRLEQMWDTVTNNGGN
jgi:hypothetical protein